MQDVVRSAEIQGSRGSRGWPMRSGRRAHASNFRPISSDAKTLDGLDFCDEIASHRTSEVYGWAAVFAAGSTSAASDTILGSQHKCRSGCGRGCANA